MNYLRFQTIFWFELYVMFDISIAFRFTTDIDESYRNFKIKKDSQRCHRVEYLCSTVEHFRAQHDIASFWVKKGSQISR